MDEQTEKKIRDLKLRILKTEKELQSSQHHMKLGAWLRAGHAGQINRNAEKDRLRLEDKLKDLKLVLESLIGASSPLAAESVTSSESKDEVKKATSTSKLKKAASKTEPNIDKNSKKNTATPKRVAAKDIPAKKSAKK